MDGGGTLGLGCRSSGGVTLLAANRIISCRVFRLRTACIRSRENV